jgi:uncharacterized protein
MKLVHGVHQKVVCEKLRVANSFASRVVGLIGTKQLDQEGLFIPRCNWIHTFFMSIDIDVLYVDRNGVIRKIDRSLKPWRLGKPVWSATDVVELPAGFAAQKDLKIGDTLHVGH